MGGTIITGLLVAGWGPDRVIAADKDKVRADALHELHGIHAATDAAKAVNGADVVVIAVKPQDVGDTLDAIAGSVSDDALILSVAAGIPTAFFESRLGDSQAVVRAMPNTPAIVGRGATAIAAGQHATEDHLNTVAAVLRATGLIVRVDEDKLGAVTALSGSGPAYFYVLEEALTEAGVEQGLDRLMATQLAAQTFVGAAHLLEQSGDTPQTLRKKVSSPGGTTIAALQAMDKAGILDVVKSGAAAAAQRAIEMSDEYGS